MFPIKFLVLGEMRSGTTVINECLESHPDLKIAYEIMHPKSSPELTNLPNISAIFQDLYGQEKLSVSPVTIGFEGELGVYKTFDASHDLSKFVDRVLETHNGFKILYWQVKRESQVWKHLQQLDLKVIHVIRRNYLDMLVSIYLARKSGVWQLKKGEQRPQDDQVTIPYEVAKGFFEYMDSQITYFNSLFPDALVIEYDEIQNWSKVTSNLQDFLGVRHVELPQKYEKRTTGNRLKNLADLSQAFKGTTYQWFFRKALYV